MDKHSLDLRTGLPDALRALVAEFPRESWENDPGFHGLVSFWLDRHMMFRRLLEMLGEETRTVLNRDGEPRRFAGAVSRLGGMLVGELHGHHQIEDLHYFPKLATLDPRLKRGFDILDTDHHDLDRFLSEFTDQANATLRSIAAGGGATDAAAGFETALGRLDRLLDRHLLDEEDLVVPVILKFGEGRLG